MCHSEFPSFVRWFDLSFVLSLCLSFLFSFFLRRRAPIFCFLIPAQGDSTIEFTTLSHIFVDPYMFFDRFLLLFNDYVCFKTPLPTSLS